MAFFISFIISASVMLLVSTILNMIFGVEYFYNAIFFVLFTLGLTDITKRKLDSHFE